MTALFGRKKKLIINEPDPEYQVIYLGNVLTPVAKNELDKPLALIWRTYSSHTRPDLPMALKITAAGLKARTKQQGLTEYWAHRIVYCWAPPHYPRLFCWVYKHEGKKMKPEMRCHAVLCKKPEQPASLAQSLQEKITAALMDYKREKLAKQNLRLSASTAAGYQPSVPRRRLLLNTSGQNFRPPLARSKSAPRLHSIDEEFEEGVVDDDDAECADDYDDVSPPSSIVAAASRLTPYSARLSSDSEYASASDAGRSTRGLSSETGNSTPGSSSDDASPDLPTTRRRDSTFDFMRVVDEDFDVADAAADDLAPNVLKHCSPPAIVVRTSTLVENGGDDDDSVSNESGYHEEKLSPLVEEKTCQFEDDYAIVISL